MIEKKGFKINTNALKGIATAFVKFKSILRKNKNEKIVNNS